MAIEKEQCVHDQVEVKLYCPDCGQEFDSRQINRADLDAQQVAELPEREAMSLVNANIAAPINLAAALNVLSDSSLAYANAEQTAPVDQSTFGSNPLGG
jgi:hypothetical protein